MHKIVMETIQPKTKIHLQKSINPAPFDKILVGHEQASYYRSQLFTPNYAINSLIACAAPLIIINNKLKALSSFDNLHLLYQQLEHEINAFVTKAQNRSYPTEAIMLAQYILCIILDETILTSTWGHDWQTHTLLSTFYKEASNERFLQVVERILEKPNSHLELLELVYLILRLGYRGEQVNAQISQEKIAELVDQIYQVIRTLKNEPQQLFQKEEHATTRQTFMEKLLMKKSFLLLFTIIISVITGFAYLGCSFTIAEMKKPLQLQLDHANLPKVHDT
jgi:type VI secretion system protein ImpK